ncbi:MAG: hypothetical protein Q9159_003242 [Coniocarpon cinnabarinum]
MLRGDSVRADIDFQGYGNANWIDVLIHDRAPPNTLCYNFAWFGATVLRSPGDPPVGQYYAFEDQLDEFQNVREIVDWQSSSTLFLSWFGVNDVALNTVLGISLENGADATNRYDGIITPYFDQLDLLYQAGARDYLILTVPPVDRAPVAIAKGFQSVADTMTNISAFNQVLRDEAQIFPNEHPGSRISILDTSVSFNQVLNNPSQYGASRNATCDNSDGHTCLWSNNAHPAFAIHQALGQAVYDQLNDLGFWSGMYSDESVDPSPQRSGSSSLLATSTLWLSIFVVGFAVGRSVGLRGRSWSRELMLG